MKNGKNLEGAKLTALQYFVANWITLVTIGLIITFVSVVVFGVIIADVKDLIPVWLIGLCVVLIAIVNTIVITHIAKLIRWAK